MQGGRSPHPREWSLGPCSWKRACQLGDVDVGLTTIEASFGRGLTRVHRNVREMERDLGETTLLFGGDVGAEDLRVPVSRDHAKAVRDQLLENATGRSGRSGSQTLHLAHLPKAAAKEVRCHHVEQRACHAV